MSREISKSLASGRERGGERGEVEDMWRRGREEGVRHEADAGVGVVEGVDDGFAHLFGKLLNNSSRNMFLQTRQ